MNYRNAPRLINTGKPKQSGEYGTMPTLAFAYAGKVLSAPAQRMFTVQALQAEYGFHPSTAWIEAMANIPANKHRLIMANTVYENFILESKLTELLNTKLAVKTLMTVDASLVESAGMIKKINKYTYSGTVQKVAAGDANTSRGSITFETSPYEVEVYQQTADFLDEDAMQDNKVVDLILEGASTTMVNDLNTKFFAELAKATLSQTYTKGGAISYDTVVDAISKMNLEDESGLFLVIGTDQKAVIRKDEDFKSKELGKVIEKLAAYGSGTAYECTLSPAFTGFYRASYDLGDILTIEDETLSGGTLDAILSAVTEVYESGGTRLDVTLGYDASTLSGVLSRISDSTKSLIQTDTVSFDTITTMETSIEQMNGYISLKADQTTTDTLGNAIQDNYTEFTQTAKGFSYRIGTTEGALTGVNSNLDTLNTFKQTQETLIRADGEGIHIGRNTDKVGMLLAPTKLSLTDNEGNEAAWMSNSKTYIPNAQITNTLQIAGVQFVKYTSGRLALKWVG